MVSIENTLYGTTTFEIAFLKLLEVFDLDRSLGGVLDLAIYVETRKLLL